MVLFLALISVLAAGSAEKEQSRWSRQISSYTSDISDWVPLPAPVDGEMPQIRRQSIAEPRILTEPFPAFVKPTGFSQDGFPSRAFYNSPANRQLYIQSVPSAPQNYLSDQGFNQGLRFGLTQPNFPLSQGFIAPQFNFDNIPQLKQKPHHVLNPIKFDSSSLKVGTPISTPIKQFSNQVVKAKPDAPKFVDGFRVANNSDSVYAKEKPQSSQKIKFEHSDKSKEIFDTGKTKVEREEVQLLYVPVESLNRGQFNFRSPLTSAQLLNSELYSQNSRPSTLTQNLAGDLQRSVVQPMDLFNSQAFMTKFNSHLHGIDNSPIITTPIPTTTLTASPKPKKLKPHQPPLAIFLTDDAKKNDQIKVGDVLHSLKNANTVAVIDSVNPQNAPKVFIGPSSLVPPENYVKFELPYLSNIENIDKKLKQLPFFVAPLSYNTPQGFAKIPFPSPHVGSVVINSYIKDTTFINSQTLPTSNEYSKSYSNPLSYQQGQRPITQKPFISYYSTSAPKETPHVEQNYYSIEPQPVSTIRPIKQFESNPLSTQSTPHKTGTYFLHNTENQYNPPQFVNFPQDVNYGPREITKVQSIFKPESTTTAKTTTTTTTTKSPSTYPKLETHNPYSINQAFHFSTPLDYHNFFDEYKEVNKEQDMKQPLSPPTITINSSPTPTTENIATVQQPKVPLQSQQLQNYKQKYNPEIQHVSNTPSSRYPVFSTNEEFTKIEQTDQTDYTNVDSHVTSEGATEGGTQTASNINPSQEYSGNIETQSPILEAYTEENSLRETSIENTQPLKTSSDYSQYDSSSQESSSTSSTTTNRTPMRSRGRPRYPPIKHESYEHSTRATITRRPLRERKPLRNRYEHNKITTETPTRKPLESGESTTKSTRTRVRGRVHYKPSDNDDIYSRRNKPSSKENDLAYQRDVLHQNYPVTLMERTSTLDIEAITEPSEKALSTNNQESTNKEDAVDAYSHDKLSLTGPLTSDSKDLSSSYTTVTDSITENSYVPKTRYDEQSYRKKGNNRPHDSIEPIEEVKVEHYTIQTPTDQEPFIQDMSVATKLFNTVTEENVPVYSSNDQIDTTIHDEAYTYSPGIELKSQIVNEEINPEQEPEVNIVETTPSYNRVRVRPGVIRQYHQAPSTESSRVKHDRRKPFDAVTYRPAFDRRRTTMRIDEIEADLKTKQVHIRPEYQDYKQPVYKPEQPIESFSTSTTTETPSKHNQFRRRRPSYATTSTEGTVTRRPYEIKNRYRGRRPTEKPTEKSELPADTSTTTVKSNLYNRYSHRPRLSERYNKKEEIEDQTSEGEDQESNPSINRPKYAAPESEHWSPKISKDSFKPYNPNNIVSESKTEVSNTRPQAQELDIITAKNEFEDILISVTPATNHRLNKKIPDIPPTLEALVEHSKVTKSDSTDNMSTFESMLEEVMKSLEEQDENEYTNNVMKHKGGEIGEIPPERIISSGEIYSIKSTTPLPEEITTALPDNSTYSNKTEKVPSRNTRRRGFWKKVKVRPVTEEIDVAESQYYPHVINRLGEYVSKTLLEKSGKNNRKPSVTTYKPNYKFLKNIYEAAEDTLDIIPNIDIPKLQPNTTENNTKSLKDNVKTTEDTNLVSTEKINPGDMDLGTGSPEPTFDDNTYYSEPTQVTASNIDRSDRFSFMDYLFGVTSSDNTDVIKNDLTSNHDIKITTQMPNVSEVESETANIKATTEGTYIPDEITTEVDKVNNESIPETAVDSFIEKINKEIRVLTEKSIVKVESSSVSSFMDPTNVVSTSMSTEVSHETEICFRGKCIKTNKNIL